MQALHEIIQEIHIPVPWGYVAGKLWGDEKNPIVLVFHGLLDNAGSFDNLVPLLPKSHCYVCIDLPGHGQSSHFPPHLPIHTTDYIIVYQLIMKHFNRDKYIIMGHSYGGQIGLLFTVLYPRLVEKLILLDTISPLPVPPEQFRNYLLEKFSGFLSSQEKLALNKEPSYTYEEAFDKIQSRRNYGIVITSKAASGLLKRAVEPLKDGRYRFTIDQRLKHWINPLTDLRYVAEMLKYHPVKCPLLVILASESEIQRMYMKPVLNVFDEWKNATIKEVDGDHDVHNSYPERVAPLVIPFLLNEKTKL